MIDLYTFPTPNGFKASIMLEETGLEYRTHVIDIAKGDQFSPDFLKISPNNKIPAITDRDEIEGDVTSVFESGAILWYLAEKTGQFLPSTRQGRLVAMEWLMFQMGGIGPMLGQAHHFLRFAPEQVPYAMTRYSREAQRIYSVVDRRLAEQPYLAGPEYTIADMAAFPWLRHGIENPDFQGINPDSYPYVRGWYKEIIARDGVVRGLQVPKL